MEITEDQLDQLGRLADTVDNYVSAAKLPFPATTHAQHLAGGMERIAAELKQLYVAISGDNPWDTNDDAGYAAEQAARHSGSEETHERR